MAVVPPFMKVPLQQQKENFHQLNDLEAARIRSGLRLPEESDWSVADGINKANAKRNRYTNVFPYDISRVKLPLNEDATGTDYINASYVKLYSSLKNSKLSADTEKTLESELTPPPESTYIAAQGPLEATVNQFWSMAYNESEKQNNEVILIVMVTPLTESGMVKCNRYWPDKDQKVLEMAAENKQDGIDISGLTLEHVSETYDEIGDFLLTEMNLKSSSKSKKVYHFYYYKWADSRVPASIYPLLYLSEEINSIRKLVENPPIPIVHCSAGVGRTGTFIAIDHLFRDFDKFIAVCDKAKSSKGYDIDFDPVFQTVLQLRDSRMMMVQTAYQFSFLYESAKKLYKERFK
ncbi:hypothetical protein G9P44_005665 [Scheffersomyces stipitis]|nr:hypothetical protein G9P44_005665 [Scheffersomyces stipitis]